MRISLQRNASGQMVLQFPGVAGNRYAVEYRADLANGDWTAVTAPVFTFPTAAVGLWIDDGTQTGGLVTARFYRRVQLP